MEQRIKRFNLSFLLLEREKIRFWKSLPCRDTPSFCTVPLSLQRGNTPDSTKWQLWLWQSSSDLRRKRTKYSLIAQISSQAWVCFQSPSSRIQIQGNGRNLSSGFIKRPGGSFSRAYQRCHIVTIALVLLHVYRAMSQKGIRSRSQASSCSSNIITIKPSHPKETPAALTAATHAVLFLEQWSLLKAGHSASFATDK